MEAVNTPTGTPWEQSKRSDLWDGDHRSWKIGHMRLSRVPVDYRQPKANPAIGPKLLRHLFLFSVVWQIANVIVICLADATTQERYKQNYDIGVAFMLFFQLLHLVFVVVTSIKLCKQVMHKTASPLFVVQSFLSTIFLFAGLYTLVHRIEDSSFVGFDDLNLNSNAPYVSFQIFIKFLYFSTATMTTVGYGDVTPVLWYTELLVTFEMFLSVTYSVVIFAQGLAHFNTPLILEPDDDGPNGPNNELEESQPFLGHSRKGNNSPATSPKNGAAQPPKRNARL